MCVHHYVLIVTTIELVSHVLLNTSHISHHRKILVEGGAQFQHQVRTSVYGKFLPIKLYRWVSVLCRVFTLCMSDKIVAALMHNCLPVFFHMHSVDRDSHYNYMCLFPSSSSRGWDVRVVLLACLFLCVQMCVLGEIRWSYVWLRSVNFFVSFVWMTILD